VTVLAVNWTGILAIIATVVAAVAIIIASLCVVGLIHLRRATKLTQQMKVTDDADRDGR
jgi:hypothetical protein